MGLVVAHRLAVIIGGDYVIGSALLGLMGKADGDTEPSAVATARSSGRLIMTGVLSPVESYIRNSLLGDLPSRLTWSFTGTRRECMLL